MNSSQTAQTFIDNFVPQADALWTKLARARWNQATTGHEQYKEEQIRLKLQEHKLYEDVADWERVQAFYQARDSYDPLLKRQVEVLHRTFLNNQSTKEENERLARLEGDVQQIYYNHRATVNGRTISDNEIADILKNSTSDQERREAWLGSKEVGEKVAPLIRQLAHLRNQIARRVGFRDYYHFSLTRQEIDETTLFELFDRLAHLTASPFRKVKALVDSRLSDNLGVPADQLAPWHYADPFFQRPPAVFDADLDSLFAGMDVANLSVRAFDGMGLEVRDILDRSDLYEREGKNQHAFCTRIGRDGDTRILCNLRPNARWVVTQMHELGHAIYNKHLPLSLPYLLRTPAHTNSTEAIAMLMGRLPHNPAWLVEVAGQDKTAVAALAGELNRELAASQLVFVRWVLVMMHFERALYADPDRPDLNQLWWELVEKYQGLARPDGRDVPDWAAKYHVALAPVYYHNYVLGELTTSQLENWLGRESGDLVENPAASQLLVEQFFSHGAHYPWNELVEVATGQPLQPEYFVDQFVSVFAE